MGTIGVRVMSDSSSSSSLSSDEEEVSKRKKTKVSHQPANSNAHDDSDHESDDSSSAVESRKRVVLLRDLPQKNCECVILKVPVGFDVSELEGKRVALKDDNLMEHHTLHELPVEHSSFAAIVKGCWEPIRKKGFLIVAKRSVDEDAVAVDVQQLFRSREQRKEQDVPADVNEKLGRGHRDSADNKSTKKNKAKKKKKRK